MGRATGKNNKNLGALDLIKGLYETLGGAGRGVTSATLGLPGDIEGLLRMLTPGISNETLLPNTDKVMKYIPGPDNTMSELGRNLPLTPTQAVKVASPLARGAAGQIHRGMMGLPRYVTPEELAKIQSDLGAKAMKTDMGKALDDPNFGHGWEPDEHIEF